MNTESASTLVLEYPVSSTMKINDCCLRYPVCGIYSSLHRLRHFQVTFGSRPMIHKTHRSSLYFYLLLHRTLQNTIFSSKSSSSEYTDIQLRLIKPKLWLFAGNGIPVTKRCIYYFVNLLIKLTAHVLSPSPSLC